MNVRKFILETFRAKLPLDIIITICKYLPKNFTQKITKKFTYKSGYRKDKLRYHYHFH